jgi:hypothetical protein
MPDPPPGGKFHPGSRNRPIEKTYYLVVLYEYLKIFPAISGFS